MQMVRCNAMATDETEEKEGLLMVLVTRSNPARSAAVTTAEWTIQLMALTGTPAERRYMESKWWERLWQAMLRVSVQMSKSHAIAQTVELTAKP